MAAGTRNAEEAMAPAVIVCPSLFTKPLLSIYLFYRERESVFRRKV
jgi:hypothetical protein